MENFNNIPNSGTYGAAIALINANFQLTKEQLERLEHSREGFCGMYNTSTALQAAYPNPTTGLFAYVGTDFPMSVYLVSNGAWYESSQEYDGGGIDLTQYASTSSVTALASRVATLEDAGYLLAGIANPSVAPDSSNHDKRYLFAWTPGTYSSYGQFTINNGEFGILIYNGSSWSLSKTDLIAKSIAGGYDTVPTEDSTKPITSGAVYDALEDIGDTIPNVSNFGFAEVVLYPEERINIALRYAQEAITGFTLLSATASKAGLMSADDKAKVDAFLGNLRSIVFADTTTSGDQATKINETLKITVNGVQEAVTTLQLLAATTSKAGLLSAADKAKLDNFLTNVRSMVFADTTASADESTKLTETLKWTVGGAQEIITSLTMLAATTSKAGLLSAADKAKLDALWSSGYQFAGIATPSTTPISTTSKIFYIATEAGTYFNAVTVTKGINILSWDGTTWSAVQVVGIDHVPTEGSGKLVESGGVFAALNPDINYTEHKYLGKDGNLYDTGNAFSVSDYYFVVPGLKIVNSRASNAVSSDYTFLCFYDINKNFISRLRRDSESTQSTDYTLLAGDIPANAVYFKASVEYGNNHTRIEIPYRNVALAIDKEFDIIKVPVRFETGNAYLSQFGKVVTTSASSFYTTLPIMAEAGIVLHNCHAASSANNTFVAFYDVRGVFAGALTNSSSSAFDYTVQAADIPDNAVYMRATMYGNGYVTGYSYYADTKKLKEITDDIADLSSVPVGKLSGCYLKSDGSLASVSLLTFCVTDFCPVKRGIEVIKAHRASAEDAGNTIICFYDGSYNFISNITASSSTTNYTIDTIPLGAVYFRATVWDDGYVNYKVPVSQLVKTRGGGFTKMFDYGTALGMDKDVLINSVETASNGRCTVIYDEEGYPSLMYKIPKVSIGALVPELGTTSDVHPAFIVDETEKDYIYMSVFMTSLYDGHYVSWFGLQPAGHIELPNLREGIASKGDGWHLETIYERSLLALLTMKLNSPTPTGNTNKGMSHLNPWEYCQLANGNLPGVGLPSRTGIEWINGTQPSAWAHNKELWGIQDVIGGYHRICDLMKLVNGKIYLAPDNNFFKKGDDPADFEDSWEDTGAAFDYIGNNIVLNTSVTNPMSVDSYVEKSYQQIGCTTEYDSMSVSTRKKLSLLLMAPKLLSTDTETVLCIDGRVGINNNKELCYGVFGGAEEYEGSGLGSQITAYPIDDNSITGHNAHYNMGSRIVYIP